MYCEKISITGKDPKWRVASIRHFLPLLTSPSSEKAKGRKGLGILESLSERDETELSPSRVVCVVDCRNEKLP